MTQPPKKMFQLLLKNAEQHAVDVKELLLTVSSLSPSLIRTRLTNVANVDVRTVALAVKVPVCMLRSKFDVAIPNRVAKNLVHAFSNGSVLLFNTNHFLLQAMPR